MQTQLLADPFAGHLFVFRGRRGNRLKILWYSGDGTELAVEAARWWPLRMATDGDGDGGVVERGAIDAARGDRLAESATYNARTD